MSWASRPPPRLCSGTSTITRSWARHLDVIRQIQARTGGFTELVPLPFVHMGAPIWLNGKARPGPTWDEVVLIHAIGRICP